MTIFCPECERALAGGDVNPNAKLAMCRDCDVVFDISWQLRSRTPGAVAQREPVPLPRGFSVTRDAPAAPGGGALFRAPGRSRADVAIEWRGFRRAHRMLALIAAVWIGFVTVGLLVFGSNWRAVPHLIATAIMLGWVGVAWTSRIRIAVAGEALEVSHRSLFQRRVDRLPVGDVEQLYCKREGRARWGKPTAWRYQLRAKLRSGRDAALVAGLDEREQVIYLEQLLEDCMLIRDEAVAGELLRL